MSDFKYEFLGNMFTVDELLGVLSGNTALGVTGTAAIARVIRHLRDERDALRNAILPGPPMPNNHYVEIATAVASDRHNALRRANQAEQERDALRAAILPGARPGELANGNYVEAALQTESARRGAYERALKAETERDALQARNSIQLEIIKGLEQQTIALKAQIEIANKVRVWNIERDGNGDLLICRGEHDSGSGCTHERWVPIGRLEEHEREAASQYEVIETQAKTNKRLAEERDEALATIREITKTYEALAKDNKILQDRNSGLRQKLRDIAYRAHVALDQMKEA